MYPDLLGNFIITLIGKGYRVSIDRDPIIDGLKIHIITYDPVPYNAVKTITLDELNSMTKDVQKLWLDGIVEWVEVEFLKIRRRIRND